MTYAITIVDNGDIHTLRTHPTFFTNFDSATQTCRHFAESWLCSQVRQSFNIQNKYVQVAIGVSKLPRIPVDALHVHRTRPQASHKRDKPRDSLSQYAVNGYALLDGNIDKDPHKYSIHGIHMDTQVKWWFGTQYVDTFTLMRTFEVVTVQSSTPQAPPVPTVAQLKGVPCDDSSKSSSHHHHHDENDDAPKDSSMSSLLMQELKDSPKMQAQYAKTKNSLSNSIIQFDA